MVPNIERYTYAIGNVTISALTPESEKVWADYLRSITMQKLALNY